MVKSEKVNVVYPKLGHVAGWKIMTFGDGAHANLGQTRSQVVVVILSFLWMKMDLK